jgi:hypothetical protein
MESVLALARTLRTTVGGERVWNGVRPVYWKTVSLLAGRPGTRLTLSDGQTYRIDPAFYAWSVDKIDLEGYEGFVLRGARATLARHRPIVICAFHPEPLRLLNQSGSAVVVFMRELGYSARTLAGAPSHDPGFEELVFAPDGGTR